MLCCENLIRYLLAELELAVYPDVDERQDQKHEQDKNKTKITQKKV